ncbi:MAG: hypothetical protein LUF25_01840 [Phascolarctobacterium sp.]|nr:hypothetical protein [Phascolarctobacterium sp.]
MAIGWKELGDLKDFCQNRASDAEAKGKIQGKLTEKYGEKGLTAAYTSINKFYTAPIGAYVVAMKWNNVCGIGKITGEYEYKNDKEYAYCRPVEWEPLDDIRQHEAVPPYPETKAFVRKVMGTAHVLSRRCGTR